MVTSLICSRPVARLCAAAGFVSVAAWGSLAYADKTPGSDAADAAPVTLTAEMHPDAVHPGRVANAAVKLHVADGFHIQAHKPNDPGMIATVLKWNATPGLRIGVTAYPVPEKEKVDFADAPLLVYDGTIKLRTPVTVKSGTKPGTYKLTGSLRYQACSGSECRAPTKLPVELTVVVKR